MTTLHISRNRWQMDTTGSNSSTVVIHCSFMCPTVTEYPEAFPLWILSLFRCIVAYCECSFGVVC